jgi:hypothetical protein
VKAGAEARRSEAGRVSVGVREESSWIISETAEATRQLALIPRAPDVDHPIKKLLAYGQSCWMAWHKTAILELRSISAVLHFFRLEDQS